MVEHDDGRRAMWRRRDFVSTEADDGALYPEVSPLRLRFGRSSLRHAPGMSLIGWSG